MPTPTLLKWFAKTPSASPRLWPEARTTRRSGAGGGTPATGATGAAGTPGANRADGALPPIAKPRSAIRVGIPKVLNVWSTHQFWIGFLNALGIEKIDFSADTSEEQGREHGKGRGTVDCCYPVKCISGHYGELLARTGHRKIDLLLSPMISSLPSCLQGEVAMTLACPRVMAAPENIKAGFLKEHDAFAERGVRYAAPLAALGDPPVVPRQLFATLKEVLPGLTLAETERAAAAGFEALTVFTDRLRATARAILEQCAREDKPCLLVLARPYHMDPGIGHEIEVDLQACGYPVLWAQYLPTDPDLLQWLFAADIAAGHIRSPFDIGDVWPSSYSSNTNEILWGAKVAARLPWIAGVIRLSSYECGMDQPTYSPVQQIVERSGTLFFSFQDLDATKPAGSLKIRVETIAHYLRQRSAQIIAVKKRAAATNCPLLTTPAARAGRAANPDAVSAVAVAAAITPNGAPESQDADSFNRRGKAWGQQGEFARALADFDAALRLDPQHAVALYNRGLTWSKLGDLERAIADFDAALGLNPRDADALNNRGVAWAGKGELQRAIADYDAALATTPGDAMILFNRGLAWAATGDLERAIADYDASLAIDPHRPAAYWNRGNAWREMGNHRRAAADHAAAVELG